MKRLFLIVLLLPLLFAVEAKTVEIESLKYILLHQEYLSTDTDSPFIIDDGLYRQPHGADIYQYPIQAESYEEDSTYQYSIQVEPYEESYSPYLIQPSFRHDCQTYWVAEFIYSRKELDTYLKKNNCGGWLLVELKKSKIYQIKQEAIMKTTRREIIEEHLEGYKWKKEECPVEKLVPETLHIFNWEVDTIGSRDEIY